VRSAQARSTAHRYVRRAKKLRPLARPGGAGLELVLAVGPRPSPAQPVEPWDFELGREVVVGAIRPGNTTAMILDRSGSSVHRAPRSSGRESPVDDARRTWPEATGWDRARSPPGLVRDRGGASQGVERFPRPLDLPVGWKA
jgi:hypothetical protein